MVILRFGVLCTLTILSHVSYAYEDDPENFPIDPKTGLHRWTPDLTNMTTDEIVKFRDVILKRWHHKKFCKVSGLPNTFTWWHFWEGNWCRKEIKKNGQFVKWEDLCCEGHGTCHCPYEYRKCYCG